METADGSMLKQNTWASLCREQWDRKGNGQSTKEEKVDEMKENEDKIKERNREEKERKTHLCAMVRN